MNKSIEVDYEIPEDMFKFINGKFKVEYPDGERNSTVATATRLLWFGWLFLKFAENYGATHNGRYPFVEYKPLLNYDKVYHVKSAMLDVEYQDAMERMERMYPRAYNDKSVDKNWYLVELGFSALLEIINGNLTVEIDKNLATEKKLKEDSNAALNYAWLKPVGNYPE